ncbi:cell wall anchor protein [Capnocytophaga sp. oral taxon 878]|uniref:cell wall anchor protein n=1 Tax=Capnocytophaga sp. oral taxon 878 TaxID=1316596 RepID=UPI000D02C44B|nr:cell wall anchor protein [Capnocytophaga sp. oral taxon 878]AVM51181.1 cell wall anchor protein [Capnocytophaga sp. oral taxon 878]
MELLTQPIVTFISMLLSAFVGWLFGRPKQRLELQSSELDNVDKAVRIYREMIDDLGAKYAKAIADLNEANQRIRELENSLEKLLKKTVN